MNARISVIVPVYNVEKYFERCIRAIIEQKYSNLEIILINDGSTDRSGTICDDWAKRDSRIVVIHQNNAGQASARNRGLEIATGDYIAFVDSDDWISLDTYEYMLNLMDYYDADIVDISICETFNDNPKAYSNSPIITLFEGKDILYDYMLCGISAKSPYSACRKFYKRSSINNIRFEVGTINEDIIFNYLVLLNAKRIVKSTKECYYYFQDGESTTRGGLKQKDFDLLNVSKKLQELSACESYKNIALLGKFKYARSYFSLLSKIAFYGIADPSINKKEIVASLTGELRKYLFLLLRSPMPFNRKVIAIALCIHIKLLEVPLIVYKKLR